MLTAHSAFSSIFDFTAFFSTPFITFCLSSFAIFLAYLISLFHIPSYEQNVLSMSQSVSFWALAVSAATSVIGRLFSAYLARWCGIMAMWTAATRVSSGLCFSWIAIRTEAGLLAFSALYRVCTPSFSPWSLSNTIRSIDFFSGPLVALPLTIFPRICTQPERLGAWMCMGWTSSGIAFLIGSPIAGVLVGSRNDQTRNPYHGAQFWSGALLIVGSVRLIVLWRLLVRDRTAGSIWV
jgi:hypothetical protein